MPDEQVQATFQPNPTVIPAGGDSGRGILDRVTDILGAAQGESPDPQPEITKAQETEPEGEPEGEQVATAETRELEKLGERLGLSEEDLWKLEVRLSDDLGKRTLGDLKDSFQTGEILTRKREQFLADRADYDAGKIAWEREMAALLSAIPREALTPETIQRAQAHLRETESRNEEAILRSIPEWADAETRKTERKGIQELLGRFGISVAEVSSLNDYRLLQAHRRFLQLEKAESKRQAEAKKAVPKGIKPSNARPSAAQDHGRLKAAVTTGRKTSLDAVSEIISRAGRPQR